MSHKKLHVMACYYNPVGYRRRREIFQRFKAQMESYPNVEFWYIEGFYPKLGRLAEVYDNGNRRAFLVEMQDLYWAKETLLNALAKQLPNDGCPLAWIDADMFFENPQWVDETLARLTNQYDIVQLATTYRDLQPNGEEVKDSRGLTYMARIAERTSDSQFVAGWHGVGWAATREMWAAMGGLIDFDLIGYADTFVASAVTGTIFQSMYPHLSDNFAAMLLDYETHLHKAMPKLRAGVISGTVHQPFHGTRGNRQYSSRTLIWKKFNWDPTTDLKRDRDGIAQIAGDAQRQQAINNAMLRYFIQRNEDQFL